MSTTSMEASRPVEARPAEFEEGVVDEGAREARPISALYDLSLPITVEFGRTKMAVQEVLGLGRGSIIELDRLVGEPVDVYAGDRRFAEGEIVVIGEQFGVRITRILSSGGEPKAG